MKGGQSKEVGSRESQSEGVENEERRVQGRVGRVGSWRSVGSVGLRLSGQGQ